MHLFNRKNRVRAFKNKTNYLPYRSWQLLTEVEIHGAVWPLQDKLKQYFLQIFLTGNLSIAMFATLNGLLKLTNSDFDYILENILVTLFIFTITVKQISSFIFQRRGYKIYAKIVEHYETLIDPEEAAVLKESADQGITFTTAYVCIGCLLVALFSSLPAIRALYNYSIGIDDLKLALPHEMNYGVDHKKYWFCVFLQFSLFVYSGAIGDIAFDLSFILQVRHVQALFQIVRMTKMIEKTYSNIWFPVLLLNATVFGANLHLIDTKLDDPLELFRGFCGFLLLIIHFQVIFSHGQKIIDSSNSIYDTCFESKWLDLSIKSRELLTMMMVRSTKVCQITGAQFFPLSIETFGKMFKAGLSYYTVLRNRR